MKQYIDADKLINAINKLKDVNETLNMDNNDLRTVLKMIDKLREHE